MANLIHESSYQRGGGEVRVDLCEFSSPKQTVYPSFLSLFFLIGIELIYKVVLVSAVQQSDSVIHIYIHSLFIFFSIIMVYHKILNILPCALQ